LNFTDALDVILEHEGDYSYDVRDPGGETCKGITVNVARKWGYKGPMRTIPDDLVHTIYLKDYWEKSRCDELPDMIRLMMFDSAVNQGPARAAQFLQRALGITDDGVIGPKTLAAARKVDPITLLVKVFQKRMDHYTALKNFNNFGRGWTNRCVETLARSV